MKILLAALSLLSGAPASAADAGHPVFSIRGGAAMPGGALADHSQTGFFAGASLRHQASTHLSLGVEGDYADYGEEDAPAGIRTDASVWSGGAFLRLDFPREGWATPYVLAGAAINRVELSAQGAGIDRDPSAWHGGILAGIGADFPISKQFSGGVSGRYRSLGSAGWTATAGLELSFTLASKND